MLYRLQMPEGSDAPPSTPAPASPSGDSVAAGSPARTIERETPDYAALTQSYESDDEPSPPPAAAPEAPKTEAKPSEVPHVPTDASSPSVEGKPPVSAKPEEAKPTESKDTAAPPSTPELPLQATAPPEPVNFEKHRAEFLPKLEQLYALTDDEAEQLRVSPHEALPKLAARLHYEVQVSLYNAVMNSIPQFVNQVMDARKTYDDLMGKFFGKWPKLREKPEYLQTVQESLQAYRAAKPKATPEEMIDRGGLMAMLALGLDPSPPAPPPQAPQAPPPRPAGIGATPTSPLPVNAPPTPQDDIMALVEAELEGRI